METTTSGEGGWPAMPAFEQFYRAHYWPAVRFVERRTFCRDDARDMVAEAFRILWQKSGDPNCLSTPFLFGICRNVVGDQVRAAKRREQTQSEFATETTRRLNISHSVDEDLQEALGQLPDHQAEVLRLLYWDGLSAQDAADALGSSTQAIWAQASRARKRLKQLLKGNRDEHS